MAYNRIRHVKEFAQDLAEMNGVSIADFDAQDIEYIGMEVQCNYQDICDILGIALPAPLAPVAG